MVPERQPTNIILALLNIILFLNFTIPAPLSGNAPQQIAQCPGNEIYGYVNGTQIGKRQDYIHLEMEDLDLKECIKQCYGNHFCYSIYYDETIKNRCVFYYYAEYNCTGKSLVPTSSLKYENKPITLDCIRCPGKGDILTTTQIPTVGNINVDSVSKLNLVDDDKIKSIKGTNTIQQAINTDTSGDSSSNDKVNQTPNSSDNLSCDLEFTPNFEDVGDEIGELFTNVINDIKDEKECAKLCYKSNCDYAMYKPITKTCSFISDYIGFVKNCSSRPLQNFVIGVMESKNIETIQIECIRCRQNHIEDVKNIINNQNKHSGFNNNEGEWQSMTVDPGDAVTWPTNLQLSGHCIVVFQVEESQKKIQKEEFSNTTELQTVEQCAAYCYKSSCSNAVFEFLEHGKGICKISTNRTDICNGNLQHHYRFYTTKTVSIQCIRCLAKKPTTQSPHALLPGIFETTTTSPSESETSSLSPEQQYESNEGGKSETKSITSPDGTVDKGGEMKEDDDEIGEGSQKKTASPPSSAPVDEEQLNSGVTQSISTTNNNFNSDEKKNAPSSPTKMLMEVSTSSKEKMTTESFKTTTLLSLTTIETPLKNKTISQQTKEKEDPYLRSCVVTFQVKPFSLDDEPKENEPLMEYEFITDSVTICASKCYNNGCTGAIYNSETKKCVLQLGKLLKCIGGDTYNNYFPEKKEKIRIFCLSCTPNNFKGIEGQIKSNKNKNELEAITSTTEINKIFSENDNNDHVTSSPSVKPGSVFDKITTPNEENDETTTISIVDNKEKDESAKTHTVDQSIETTTHFIKNEITNEKLKNKEMSTILPMSINENELTTVSQSEITSTPLLESSKIDQKTPISLDGEKENEFNETTTKIFEFEKEEGTTTTVLSEISKSNEQTTVNSNINKESKNSNINSDVEGSGILDTQLENKDKQTQSTSKNEENNKSTTVTSEATKENMETTILPESFTNKKIPEMTSNNKDKNKATTFSSENIKESEQTTIKPITDDSEDNKEMTTTASLSKDLQEKTETTIMFENKEDFTTVSPKEHDNKSQNTTFDSDSADDEMKTTIFSEGTSTSKIPTVTSKNEEDIKITTLLHEKTNEGIETTISPENKNIETKGTNDEEEINVTTPLSEDLKGKVETTIVPIIVSKENEENKFTVIVPEDVNEKIDTTTVSKIEKEENKLKTTSLINKENFETTTILQEFEHETTTKNSLNTEKNFETTTINPELGLEISGDKKSSESVIPTTIKSDSIEMIFETTTILPESNTKSIVNKNDEETGTTLLIPVDFETTTEKFVSEDKFNTNEPIEGSGINEIEGKASTLISIIDDINEKETSTTGETKSTIIPIIDSEQNTENLFPEEKISTTRAPTDVEITTLLTINKESPNVEIIDKATTISLEIEKTELETIPLTDKNTTTPLGPDELETTTFSLPEMGLEISKSRGSQSSSTKTTDVTNDELKNKFTTKFPDSSDSNLKEETIINEFEKEEVTSTVSIPKIKDNDEKLSEDKLYTTTIITDFEKGNEHKTVNLEGEKDDLTSTIASDFSKQSVSTISTPTEIEKIEKNEGINEETNKSSTILSNTNKEITTISVTTNSKDEENEATTISSNISENNQETTIKFIDENDANNESVSFKNKTIDITTVASILDKEDKSTSAVSNKDNDLLGNINPEFETTVETVDFENENKKNLETISSKESNFNTASSKIITVDVTSNPLENKKSDDEVNKNKEINILTTVSPEDINEFTNKFSETMEETIKPQATIATKIEHTVEEGSGETLEEESGEPTSITTLNENLSEETTAIPTIDEKKTTENSKILVENETIEPSTISSGNEFIATTPNEMNEFKIIPETTTPTFSKQDKKQEKENTDDVNKNNKENDLKSSTELTTIDFENFGKLLNGNAFDEKKTVLKTTHSPEKEEESDSNLTTLIPVNKVNFNGNEVTQSPEKNENVFDNLSTSLPKNKVDSGNNETTQSLKNEELFSNNHTTSIPEHKVDSNDNQSIHLPEKEEGSSEIQTTLVPKLEIDSDNSQTTHIPEKNVGLSDDHTTSIPKHKVDSNDNQSTHLPEKEEGSSEIQTTLVPKLEIDSDNSQTTHVPEKNVGPSDDHTTSIPEHKVDSNDNQSTHLPEKEEGSSEIQTTLVPKLEIDSDNSQTTHIPEKNVGLSDDHTTSIPEHKVDSNDNQSTHLPEKEEGSSEIQTTLVPKLEIDSDNSQTTHIPEKNVGLSDDHTTSIPKHKVDSNDNQSTHLPEKEEGSSEIQTTLVPKLEIDSDISQTTHVPEKEEGPSDNHTTSIPEHEVDSNDNQSTHLPEKEEGSSEIQTTPVPKLEIDSDNSQTTHLPVKDGGSSDDHTTSMPEQKVDSSDNKATLSQGKEGGVDSKEKPLENNEKEEFESSGKELVNNEEFSSNNTDVLPEMGLEISRFRGVVDGTPNKTEEITVFPKTSHNEDERFTSTISTEINTEIETTTPKLKKIVSTNNAEAIKTDTSDEFSPIESKTTENTDKIVGESKEGKTTVEEIKSESLTTILPESEGSGIEIETKSSINESATEKVDVNSKNTEELFPDDEQIERIRTQFSTTKLNFETTATTTESFGPAFVTDNDEKLNEKEILIETTTKHDLNANLNTVVTKVNSLENKHALTQSSEVLITTTAIPIDEQLFTIQPFKGLDVQLTRKDQTTNNLTTIPTDIKTNEQNNQLTTTLELQTQTNDEELLKDGTAHKTTLVPKIKTDNNNNEFETSTIFIDKNNNEGSGEELVTSLINDFNINKDSQTTVPSIKTNEDLTTMSKIFNDKDDDIKTTVTINEKESNNGKNLETTTSKLIEKISDESTPETDRGNVVKGEQEDSNVTTEPLSKTNKVDLDGKTFSTTKNMHELTTISSISKEKQNEVTNFESSGEELETTTLGNQKINKISTKSQTEDGGLISTILPITKAAIVNSKDKTTLSTPLSSNFEEEESLAKIVNTTKLDKSLPKIGNENVIITASTVKTIVNETTSSEEVTNEDNKESMIHESFKQDNSQTTVGSLKTTQKPTIIENEKEQTTTKEVELEGPAFVTESPEISKTKTDYISTTALSIIDDTDKSGSTMNETFKMTTNSLVTPTNSDEKLTMKQIDDRVEELIPENKKKEEELDASKIDFGPTTIKMEQSNVEITTVEPVTISEDEKSLQSTTSTTITEDDGSIIDTSILKTGKVDDSSPKETDVTLITSDSISTTINIKKEKNIEITTVKTSLEDEIETTITTSSSDVKSSDMNKTTVVNEENKITTKDNDKNNDITNSHISFVTDEVKTSTQKIDSESGEINTLATKTPNNIVRNISLELDSNDNVSSATIETTILPKSEEKKNELKGNTDVLSQEITTTTISEINNEEDKNKIELLLPEQNVVKSKENINNSEERKVTVKSEFKNYKTTVISENLTTHQPIESEDEKFQSTKKNNESTDNVDNEEGKSAISVEDKSNVDNISKESSEKIEKTTVTFDEIQTSIIPDVQSSTQTTEGLTKELIKTETIDFVDVTTTISSLQKETTVDDLTKTTTTLAEIKLGGTAESIDAASIDKHINLPKTVGKVDSAQINDMKITKEEDSEDKLLDKEDYEDKISSENNEEGSQSKDKVHTTTEPPVEAVADLVHTLSRTNDLDLLLRGATKQLVNIRKNAKCGVNTLRFSARPMKDFSQEYEVIESVSSLYTCIETCYVTGCKKAAFVPYPQPKCLMHYELGSTLTNSCSPSSIYQLTTHWHFSNPSEVIEILCLVCDNDNENSKEKLQIENVFNALIDDRRKGMEQQAFITEICNGAGRLEFQVKPVSKFPRLNITHDVPANSPAECAIKCKENGHCDLAGFIPSPHAKSSGLCLLTSDTHYCDYEDETYKHVPQHQSEVPFLLHCIRCSKCRYNISPVIPGITEVIPFETTKTVSNIEECALQCSNLKCTIAQFNPKSLTCSTTINPSFKNTCPMEKAIQVDGGLQIRLHCVNCTN
uniref:Apple domain-containing protein n=1 Tax=Strongyloides stercoralis TaxID=6248 RepID=A0AAF5DSH5_STRER